MKPSPPLIPCSRTIEKIDFSQNPVLLCFPQARIAPRIGAFKGEKDLKELISLAMVSLDIAVTIIDTEATLLYYNKQAAEILDRKPEYIGKDVYSHHMQVTSSKKLKSMIQNFRNGRTEPFHYEAKPYEKTILVTLSPILENGRFIGCVQSVRLKEDIE